MLSETLIDVLTGPWGLLIMAALVFCDSFLVVIPGEVAVTTLGALAIAEGSPPLWAVIACAAAAAILGDMVCYLIGRWVGTQRWKWMRTKRVQEALAWASSRLEAGTATVLFSARFIPFARLAVNLVAGSSRLNAVRYFGLVSLAGSSWAAYQAAIGAAIAAIIPGGTIVAICVSVVIAIGIGLIIDWIIRRRVGFRNEHR